MPRLLRLALLVSLCPAAVLANPLERAFDKAVQNNIEGALAVLGLAAVPAETASTLLLNTGSSDDETYDFQAGQFGGGFRWSEDIPIWMEGFIGYNRYDPVLIFSDGTANRRLPFKWTSFAATGGLGYEFDLNDHWVLRPQVHLSIGRVQTDLSVGAQAIANRLGIDAEFLDDGGVWAVGAGGSLTLEYNRRWESDHELDLSLRHTHIRLEPFDGDESLVNNADAITTTLWTRYRVPTGYQAFNRPVRLVYEASGSYLPGDQGDILDTDWLAQLGFGGEVDLDETWVPWVTTTRLVARYTRGEHLEGFSIGLACSF